MRADGRQPWQADSCPAVRPVDGALVPGTPQEGRRRPKSFCIRHQPESAGKRERYTGQQARPCAAPGDGHRGSSGTAGPGREARMARVLVVDDENLMRTMVEVACRRLGHEALCAATLAEGRRLAAAGVDVILLDMLLPDGNGLDAQQELAALPDAPDIVVITGHGDGDAAEKALRGGVWDFLMKPVRVCDVEETLSHVLEARDRRRWPSWNRRRTATSTSCCWARPAWARSCSPAPCTATAIGPRGLSWPWTAPPCRKRWWRAICSAMPGGPSPARSGPARACCGRRIRARSSWTRWATCRRAYRGLFCGRWSCAVSVLWERCARWRAIFAWWRPPIRIWRP